MKTARSFENRVRKGERKNSSWAQRKAS